MVTISLPKIASSEMAIGVLGTTGGILSSEYIASTTVGAMNLTGNAVLAAGVGVKGLIGVASLYGAGRTTGGTSLAMGVFGLGSFASMSIDVIHRLFPRATEPGEVLRARAMAPVVAAPLRVRPMAVPVTAVPMMVPREFR